MKHFTGIDLGSNTLRAVVMDENKQVLQEAEFIIKAAKNLSQSGKIEDEAVQRLEIALESLILEGFDLNNVKAVATAAFRKASNTAEIFQKIKTKFKLDFELISAQEEARLSILGMQNALLKLNFKAHDIAFCDLGGASCELSFGKAYQSFDFGIISFYEKAKLASFKSKASFKPFKVPHKKHKDKKLKLFESLQDQSLIKFAYLAFEEVKKAKEHLQNFKDKIIVLNSGVPTSIVALKAGIAYKDYKAELITLKRLKLGDFLYFAKKLWFMSEEEASFWVGKERKNYLVAGCFLLYALFDKQSLIVVDEGLREGVCISKINENY